MNAHDSILHHLRAATAQKPMRGDDLLAKLGLEPDTLNELLDDLQGRGALNRAEITRDGKTWTAIWPTGLVPRNLSWKEQRDNGVGVSSLLAHNVQQAAEQSRTETKPAPARTRPDRFEKPVGSPTPATPDQTGQVSKTCLVSATATPVQTGQVSKTCPVSAPITTPETPMPRIARPAFDQTIPAVEAATQAAQPTRKSMLNEGPTQQAIMSVLEGGDELTAAEVYLRIGSKSTKASVGKVLELLTKRGLVTATMRYHNSRHRLFYRLAQADSKPAAPAITAAREAVASDADIAGTLEQLRRLGGDDQTGQVSKTCPVSDSATPDQTRQVSQTCRVSASVPNPENDGETHFALFDSGTLLVTTGDDFIALPRADAMRLADYLRGVSDALFAGAL